MNKTVFVYADDWEALYIDGKSVAQASTLTVEDVAEAIVRAGEVSIFKYAASEPVAELGHYLNF